MPRARRRACTMGLEGIVSKRLTPGRSRDWIKVKNPDNPAMRRARAGAMVIFPNRLRARINGPTPCSRLGRLHPPDMTSYQPRYDRLIIALGDDELEKFVREWALQKKEYSEVERFTGPGDMGRDVVGFLTKQRHEGPWHNYQCKQYGRTLLTATGIREVGKVLYYSSRSEFMPPTAFFFVAPRGVNRNLKRLIAKPEEFRRLLLEQWEGTARMGFRRACIYRSIQP
jgi:hypothetical protein